MENSILTSVKATLGLDASYVAFDEDIIMHINTVFANLPQLGIGPVDGFMIEDDSAGWDDYVTAGVPTNYMNSVRSLVFLKVQLMFDITSMTSFVIGAKERQITELEWRMNVAREEALYPSEAS